MVLGQLPRGKVPLRIITPRLITPEQLPSMVIEESVPQDNCPPDYFFRKITPKIIAPWQYPPGNCPRGKLSFGWFVAYIFTPRTIGPEKTAPLPLRKIVPRINYTRDIFSPRIRNLSTLIDSCFLLFSFSVI